MPASAILPEQVPVMPLPGALLFPHALLPLYVFEPRYRQMLKYVLAHHRMFCVALIKPHCADWQSPVDFFHNANAHIFPNPAKYKRTASLSNQFREILVEAGLAQPLARGHKSTGKGRDQAREVSEISFHSLRHSAVTMLKAAGVSDFIAREIVGHESAAVSRQYTHLTTDDKRAAMQRLPDVTEKTDAR